MMSMLWCMAQPNPLMQRQHEADETDQPPHPTCRRRRRQRALQLGGQRGRVALLPAILRHREGIHLLELGAVVGLPPPGALHVATWGSGRGSC